MKIAVITNERLKEELLTGIKPEGADVTWLSEPCFVEGAAIYIDLLFTASVKRMEELQQLQAELIMVNSVTATLHAMPAHFIRFNGWPGFLKRNRMEASCSREDLKPVAEKIFAAFGKQVEWVPDTPGFISARVVAMIINEAFITLQEGVSTKEEIDTAMKLGTSYPYGPFEWAKNIGLKNICSLLAGLSEINDRYTASELLNKEASWA